MGRETVADKPGHQVAGDNRFRVSPDVLSRRVGDEFVLVHVGTNRIHSLNRTAGHLWELLEEGTSPATIKHRLLSEFSVDEDELQIEIDRLIGELREAELVLDDSGK